MLKREERARLAALLHRDKAVIDDACEAAVVRELTRVAEEYFELDGRPVLSLREEKGGSTVTVSFRITRVKNFTTLA